MFTVVLHLRDTCTIQAPVYYEEFSWFQSPHGPGPGGGYSHTLPIRVCAAQKGRDFEAPDLERGIHFRGVF